MITRDQITQTYLMNDKKFANFLLTVDWEGASYDRLNFILDDPDEVEDGHLLMDVYYEPISLEDGMITFRVTVSDLSMYFDEEYMTTEDGNKNLTVIST